MKNKYELIVVGGGFAGVCAAISASRMGVDVLLIERNNALGGAAVNALVMPFMPYFTHEKGNPGNKKYLCGNLFLEIIDEMRKLNGIKGEQEFDEEIMKLVLNRMALKSGVTLLFNTVVTQANVSQRKITSIKALGKSMNMELFADNFIDATGDAELSMFAGCEYVLGRENDNLCQPMTLCFRMSGVNKKIFVENHAKLNELYAKLQAEGKIKNPREDILAFNNFNDDVIHLNTTRIVKRDPTNPFDVTMAEIEAREQVFEIQKLMSENIPGFENIRVISTALQIGIRESRKIVGEYTLTKEDLISLARFDDGIAVSNYDIDIHNPEGTGTSHHFFGLDEWYEIPYRCLVPKDIDNMLVAGRCISSTHEAQASYRIMPFCAELGQAAGTAVSVAKNNGTLVRDVDIKQVRNILRENGFVI